MAPHFCGIRVNHRAEVPVDIPFGSLFHLQGASLVSKAKERVVLALRCGNAKPYIIANFSCGVQSVKLDLLLTPKVH